jgi:FkbM family methyltransferase
MTMERHDTAGPLKLLAARALSSRLMGATVGLVLGHRIPNHGLVFETKDAVFSPRVEAQMLWRIYESAEIRFARRYLSGARLVVELGSSLGIVSSHMLSRMAFPGRMVCLEANPAVLPALERNLRTHAGGRTFEIVHAAIAYGERSVSLRRGEETYDSRVVSNPSSDTIEVPAITLSALLARCHVDSPYVLVSDIEGGEVGILLEDPGALELCDRMLVELHETTWDGRGITVEQLCARVLRCGFRVLDQRGPVFVFTR